MSVRLGSFGATRAFLGRATAKLPAARLKLKSGAIAGMARQILFQDRHCRLPDHLDARTVRARIDRTSFSAVTACRWCGHVQNWSNIATAEWSGALPGHLRKPGRRRDGSRDATRSKYPIPLWLRFPTKARRWRPEGPCIGRSICCPKIRFCNICGEDRRGQVAM
jgi:hypothetical protein